MIYWIIFIIILISCIYYDIFGLSVKKRETYVCIVLLLIALSAFRYRIGSDTLIYIDEFEEYETFWEIRDFSYFFSVNGRMCGWVFLNVLIKSLFYNYVFLQIFCALIVNIIICSFIYKNTDYVFTVLLFYYVGLYVFLNFEVMRQSLSVSFFLLFYELLLKKRPLCILYIILAFSFHESSLIYFLYIAFLFFPLRKDVLLFYFMVCFVSLVFRDIILNELIGLFSRYDTSNDKILIYFIEGSNNQNAFSIQNLLNVTLNLLIPFFFVYKNRMNPIVRPVLAYTFCYTLIYVIPIFYRFNYYFLLFFFVALIDVFCYLSSSFRQRKAILFFCVLCFVYAKGQVFFARNLDGDNHRNYVKYYPYSSIFDSTINRERERVYSSKKM